MTNSIYAAEPTPHPAPPTADIFAWATDGKPLTVIIRRGAEILGEYPVLNAQEAEARIRVEIGNLQRSDRKSRISH